MKQFIREFYDGNIDPQARSVAQNREVRKQMEILSSEEEMLLESLTGKNKELFQEYVSAWSFINGESTMDSFITGFRLGANFTYETFVDDRAPFKSLIEE